MKRIYKYELHPKVSMPFGAEILTVQTQRDFPFIWAIIDDEVVPFKTRKFRTVDTGDPLYIEGDYKYIGTYQLNGGSYVGHVFEILS